MKIQKRKESRKLGANGILEVKLRVIMCRGLKERTQNSVWVSLSTQQILANGWSKGKSKSGLELAAFPWAILHHKILHCSVSPASFPHYLSPLTLFFPDPHHKSRKYCVIVAISRSVSIAATTFFLLTDLSRTFSFWVWCQKILPRISLKHIHSFPGACKSPHRAQSSLWSAGLELVSLIILLLCLEITTLGSLTTQTSANINKRFIKYIWAIMCTL